MNIRVDSRPIAHTEELDSSDLENAANGLEDLTDDAPEGNDRRHPTPTFIRQMGEEVGQGEAPDEAAIPTMITTRGNKRLRNVLIGVAAALAVTVALLLVSRSGGAPDSGTVAAGTTETADTQPAADGIEDITVETDKAEPAAAPATEDAEEVAAPAETDATAGGYDADKCASPKSDREWMACIGSAYDELRAEQKRLTARIETLEASKAAPSAGIPLWTILVLCLQGLAIAFLLARSVSRKRKESGPAAP